LAMLVWGYALLWSLLADQVKLAAYRVLDPEQPGLLTRRGRATGRKSGRDANSAGRQADLGIRLPFGVVGQGSSGRGVLPANQSWIRRSSG
ncbi:MAG TPA: hypothetical protein VM389_09135, partial [Phycisphaerae bacterium]|nr:hypothetical protein [Phycisphaerae bacterium]